MQTLISLSKLEFETYKLPSKAFLVEESEENFRQLVSMLGEMAQKLGSPRMASKRGHEMEINSCLRGHREAISRERKHPIYQLQKKCQAVRQAIWNQIEKGSNLKTTLH